MYEDKPKTVVTETRHTVFDGVKTYHTNDMADATKRVAANRVCLQGKVKFITERNMVNQSEAEGPNESEDGSQNEKADSPPNNSAADSTIEQLRSTVTSYPEDFGEDYSLNGNNWKLKLLSFQWTSGTPTRVQPGLPVIPVTEIIENPNNDDDNQPMISSEFL